MALLSARDVFVRRPACISLWVVPASAVTAATTGSESYLVFDQQEKKRDLFDEIYAVFHKRTQKGTFIYSGDIEAVSPEIALNKAGDMLIEKLAWWVCPKLQITCSTAADIDVLFSPALTKDFRDQSFYRTVTALQQIKSKTAEGAEHEA
jgi:ring-1,2-phenylacetyl-CoA epoxidase subunit PaaB